MEKSILCFYCGSAKVVKNGRTYYGVQRYLCKDCQRQFVAKSRYKGLSNEQKAMIEKLLLERISLEGICRVLEILPHQLYAYMDEVFEEVPDGLWAEIDTDNSTIELQSMEMEADEAWSFVGCSANKKWIWVAKDRATHQIVGLHIGQRDRNGALGLWKSLPEVVRRKAIFYTDDWKAYRQVLPSARHVVTEKRGPTSHIERFFCTLRQRVSRLVRKTLSFSKKFERHVKAIRYFVAYYNLSLHV